MISAGHPLPPVIPKASWTISEKKTSCVAQARNLRPSTLRRPVRLVKSYGDFAAAVEAAKAGPYKIPEFHRTLKAISNIPLYARMREIVENDPTIVGPALIRQAKLHAAFVAKPVSDCTMNRYLAAVRLEVRSRSSMMNIHAAMAYAAWFRDTFGGYVGVNIDESYWGFRLQSKRTVGAKPAPHQSVSIGMMGVSWSDGRRAGKWRVATPSFAHRGMSWDDFPHLHKVESASAWVPGQCLVDELHECIMPGIQPGQKAVLVLDGLKTHGKELAIAAMKMGGKVGEEVVGGKVMPVFNFSRVQLDGNDEERDYKPLAASIREAGCIFRCADGRSLVCVFLPPGTTGLLQPCDISIFGAVKKGWKNGGQCDLWFAHLERTGHLEASWSNLRDHISYKDALSYLNNFVETCDPQIIEKGWEPLLSKVW